MTPAESGGAPSARKPSTWLVVGIAVAVVWLPCLVPLALNEWFQIEEYRAAWLRGLPYRPGALLASLIVLPIEHVAMPLFHALAGFLAVVFCLAVVYLALRWPRARPWIFVGAGVISLLQSLLLAWAATHG